MFLVIILGVVLLLFTVLIPLALQIFKMLVTYTKPLFFSFVMIMTMRELSCQVCYCLFLFVDSTANVRGEVVMYLIVAVSQFNNK